MAAGWRAWEREWARKRKGRDISARLSHCTCALFERASRSLNIQSIKSPQAQPGDYDSDAEVGLGWEI